VPRRFWRMRRRIHAELTDALVCYLALGCIGLTCSNHHHAFDLDIYRGVYAEVIRGRLGQLRALWARHGETLKAGYPGRPLFAELVLSGLTVHQADARLMEFYHPPEGRDRP
jgi:hypothetical protein